MRKIRWNEQNTLKIYQNWLKIGQKTNHNVIGSSKFPLKENSRTRWFYMRVQQNIQKKINSKPKLSINRIKVRLFKFHLHI